MEAAGLAAEGVVAWRRRLEARVLAPLVGTGRAYYVMVVILLALVAWGGYAYAIQFRQGMYATGLHDRIFWGVYFTLFIYFLAASAGVTLVSSLLRLTNARWRAPVTRASEILTIALLIVALMAITVNMSAPHRMLNVLLFGRWESQLVWDVYALVTTLVGRMIYLSLGTVRDYALCRDRIGHLVAAPRRLMFLIMSMGWNGNPEQARNLLIGQRIMAIVIVPVAVMTPTVAAWIFGMMLREPWDSPMFGIYFLGGAIYSGIAMLIIFMIVLRRAYRLEEFITPTHFMHMGHMLVAFAVAMLFFNVSDFITRGYKMSGDAALFLHEMVQGEFAFIYWTYFWVGLVLPIVIMIVPFTRRPAGVVVAAVAAAAGILFERYFTVVGGLQVPLNPYDPPSYAPTWVEWSVGIALFALLALLVTVTLKFVPVISLAEMEHAEPGVHTEPVDEPSREPPAEPALAPGGAGT